MKPQYSRILTVAIASSFMIPFGQSGAWPMIAIPLLSSNDNGLVLTSDQVGWIASITGFFVVIGSLMAKYLMDSIGRKNSLIIAMLPFISAYGIMELNTFEGFIIGRSLVGIGGGFVFVLSIYFSEIAGTETRGRLTFVGGMVANFSTLIVLLVSPFMTLRNLNVVFIGSNVIVAFLLFTIPESPYYFIMKDDSVQAEKSLYRLRDEEEVIKELKMIQIYVDEKRKETSGFLDLWRSPGNRRALLIIVWFFMYLQFGGTSVIKDYSGVIFQKSKLGLDENFQMAIVQVVVILATGVTALYVDRWGRRLVLIISSIVMIAALSILTLFFILQESNYDTDSYSWIPLFSLMLLNASKYAGLRPLSSLLLSEYYPLPIKATASSAVSFFNALSGAMSVKMFQVLTDSLNFGPVLLFCLFTFTAGTIVMYMVMPETRNLSLMDIEDLFNERKEKILSFYFAMPLFLP